MKLIESKTLNTDTAAIEFTSIPQTYTDLLILMSMRNSEAEGSGYIEFNLTASGYSRLRISGNGTGAASNTNITDYIIGRSDYTANTFSNSTIYIPNYTSSNNKTYSVETVNENNATAISMHLVAGLWANTNAITSFKLTPQPVTTPNFITDSTVSLYGITKGSSGGVTVS
jgi:hypothetical protein